MLDLGIKGNVLFRATDKRTGRVREIAAKNTVRGVAGTWARKSLWNNTNRDFYYSNQARCWLYNSSYVAHDSQSHLVDVGQLTTGRIGNLNSTTERSSSGSSMTYRWRFDLSAAYTIARAYWLIPNGTPEYNSTQHEGSIDVLAYVDNPSNGTVSASETLDVEWTFTFSGGNIDGLSRIASRLSGASGYDNEQWANCVLRWAGEGGGPEGTPMRGDALTGEIPTSGTIRDSDCYMMFAASGSYTGTNEVDVQTVDLLPSTGSSTVLAHLDKPVTIGNGSTFSGTATFGGLRHN